MVRQASSLFLIHHKVIYQSGQVCNGCFASRLCSERNIKVTNIDETIEKSENLFIPKDSCQFITLHSNANIRKKYFTYLKKTNMLNNFRNLYNKVMAVPELSSIRYSEFTDKKNKEKFVGVMPHGHPDEKCHSFIADTIYNDMKEKRLW